MSNKEKKGRRSPVKVIVGVLNGSFLTRENFVRNMPFLFFVVGLMVAYIGYGYYAERTVRDLHKVGMELKEVRSDYISKRAELEHREQQSKVADDIKGLGLKESKVPPFKIEVEPEILEELE